MFIPADLERGKVITTLVSGPTLIAVEGTYGEVNRLCAEVGDKYRWAFVNINIRPYYAEGSKTYGYEIAEQMGWRGAPPRGGACAGGAARPPTRPTPHEGPGGAILPPGPHPK